VGEEEVDESTRRRARFMTSTTNAFSMEARGSRAGFKKLYLRYRNAGKREAVPKIDDANTPFLTTLLFKV
jgi:hypothetical protein